MKELKNSHTGIKRIEDASGEVLEAFEKSPEQVLPQDTARMMNDILSDNAARTPAFGPNSPLHFEDYDVAAKTGTTNNYRDLWTVGYSPNLAVGVWSGNNDNTPVDGEVAGFVVAPMWHAFMETALDDINHDQFIPPEPTDDDIKPILRGVWQPTSETSILENSSVPVRRSENITGVHSILHWVDKNNPRGPVPVSPSSDPQYDQWEYSVRRWASGNGFSGDIGGEVQNSPDSPDANETNESYEDADTNFLELTSSIASTYNEDDVLRISATNNSRLDRLEIIINGELVDDDDSQPFSTSIELDDIDNLEEDNQLLIRGLNDDKEENTIRRSFRVED